MHVPSWPSRLPAARPGWGLSLRKTCSGASQPLVPEAQAPPSALGPRPQPGCPPWASLSVSRTAPATSGWAPGWAPGACSGGTGLGGRRPGPPQLHWDNGALPSPRLSWLGQGKDEGVSGQVMGGSACLAGGHALTPTPPSSSWRCQVSFVLTPTPKLTWSLHHRALCLARGASCWSPGVAAAAVFTVL